MPGVAGGPTFGGSRPLDSSPSELLTAMSALPPGHPTREEVRDRAIKAWLPMADSAAHLGIGEEWVLEGREGARAYTATSLVHAGRPRRPPRTRRHPGRRGPRLRAGRCPGRQTEIAGRPGISQMHVSRLIARSLGRLRHLIDPDDG